MMQELPVLETLPNGTVIRTSYTQKVIDYIRKTTKHRIDIIVPEPVKQSSTPPPVQVQPPPIAPVSTEDMEKAVFLEAISLMNVPTIRRGVSGYNEKQLKWLMQDQRKSVRAVAELHMK
jgi:hypothetical protein